MATTTSDFYKGMILKIDNAYWEIVDFQFVSPGKGSAFTRANLRNLETGKTVEKTYKSGETFEEVEFEKKEAEYIYADRKNAVFQQKGERISIPLEVMGEKMGYLIPKTMVDLAYVEGKCIDVHLPKKVNLKVTESPPNLRGNTAGAVTKSVTLETNLKLNVPAFIEEGDIVRVNTETGLYTERVTE